MWNTKRYVNIFKFCKRLIFVIAGKHSEEVVPSQEDLQFQFNSFEIITFFDKKKLCQLLKVLDVKSLHKFMELNY